MPLFHVAGANMGMLGLLQGARDVIMKEVDPAKMLALLAKTQASMETPNDWILVPAAEFEMGAEGGPAQPDEGPKHKVFLDAFYIDKYEVTNRQYHTFVKSTGHQARGSEDAK